MMLSAFFVLGFTTVLRRTRRERERRGRLPAAAQDDLRIRRRRGDHRLRHLPHRPDPDPLLRARDALRRPHRRRPPGKRVPAGHGLRLRLDTLHRAGAGRHPHAHRDFRRCRPRRRVARGLLAGARRAVPDRGSVHGPFSAPHEAHPEGQQAAAGRRRRHPHRHGWRAHHRLSEHRRVLAPRGLPPASPPSAKSFRLPPRADWQDPPGSRGSAARRQAPP